jgi:thymidylate kinase
MRTKISLKRKMAFSVALVGPDGAGKTTIARRLERDHPLPVRYLYMGVNAVASNQLLPTTRLLRRFQPARAHAAGGPPDPTRARLRPASVGGRVRATVRSGLRVGNLVAEEWYRQLRAWGHLRRGRIVVFDRHFLSDFHAHDISLRPSLALSRRLHGFLLARFYPRPDLVICLDAPPEVLYSRKAEGTVDLLARRRQEYLDLAAGSGELVVIDASRPLDDVAGDVFAVVSDFARDTTRLRMA